MTVHKVFKKFFYLIRAKPASKVVEDKFWLNLIASELVYVIELVHIILFSIDNAELIAPLLYHLSLNPLRILASCTDPFSDHALELSHPAPFHQMNTKGKRNSENEKGFALSVLVFEVVQVHSVGGGVKVYFL